MRMLGVVSIADPVDVSVGDAVRQVRMCSLTCSMKCSMEYSLACSIQCSMECFTQLRSDDASIVVATGDQLATAEWVVREAGIVPTTAHVIELCAQRNGEADVERAINELLSGAFFGRRVPDAVLAISPRVLSVVLESSDAVQRNLILLVRKAAMALFFRSRHSSQPSA